MRCEICDQEFPDANVKVFRSMRVCPVCFPILVAQQAALTTPQVVVNKHVTTTVCPECNAELHADTRMCPQCGALVARVDRMFRSVLRLLSGAFAVFGLLVIALGLGVSIQRNEPAPAAFGVPIGLACLSVALWGFRRTRTIRPIKPEQTLP